MASTKEPTFPFLELSVDMYELEREIKEAFAAGFGEEEVMHVHVSRFPHEYGALVLLRHEPSVDTEALALEQEERFMAAGIRVGILVRKAKDNLQTFER